MPDRLKVSFAMNDAPLQSSNRPAVISHTVERGRVDERSKFEALSLALDVTPGRRGSKPGEDHRAADRLGVGTPSPNA
jgi:hypothetical protein